MTVCGVLTMYMYLVVVLLFRLLILFLLTVSVAAKWCEDPRMSGLEYTGAYHVSRRR